jgi:hypothetical protein
MPTDPPISKNIPKPRKFCPPLANHSTRDLDDHAFL